MSILALYKPANAVQYTAAGLAANSQVLELVVPRKIVRRVGRDLQKLCRAGVTSPTACRSSVNEGSAGDVTFYTIIAAVYKVQIMGQPMIYNRSIEGKGSLPQKRRR